MRQSGWQPSGRSVHKSVCMVTVPLASERVSSWVRCCFPFYQQFQSILEFHSKASNIKQTNKKDSSSGKCNVIKFPFLACFALGQRVGAENYSTKLSVSTVSSSACARHFCFKTQSLESIGHDIPCRKVCIQLEELRRKKQDS